MRAKSDGTHAQKESLDADIVGADGVCEAPSPPLARIVEAIATLSRRASLALSWDCVGRIPAMFVTPEIAFVMQENEVKVRRPPQVPSVITMREGSAVLTASAAAFCFFSVDIVGMELDSKFSGA